MQGNSTKCIGVPQALRVLMLQERCKGHDILRAHDCGGRGWNWEGRRVCNISLHNGVINSIACACNDLPLLPLC